MNVTKGNFNNSFDIEQQKRKYCPHCDIKRETFIKNLEETYNVRGEDISITSSVRVCQHCEGTIFDEALDADNIDVAFQKYRERNEFLLPEQIVEIRNKYGLSQRGLAILLNWGPATVSRYEKGAIPSQAHHTTLLNLKEDTEFAQKMFQKSQGKLGKLDFRRMQEKLLQEKEQSLESDTISLLVKKINSINDPIYHGYTSFEFNKLANLVLYFTNRINRVSKTKLMKLLFYADFKNYQEVGLSISGLSYKHLPFGPVPDHYLLILESLTENQMINLLPFDDYEGEFLEPMQQSERSLFDEDEIQVIEQVIDKFETFSARQISSYSHQEEGYLKTEENDYISYDYADLIKK